MSHLPLRLLAVMITVIAILRLDPAPAGAATPSRATTDHHTGSVYFLVTDRLVMIDATVG